GMFAQQGKYILIDEIENGIHYTNLDKLWEIILTISEKQNVQVFATTHSKECIESYARVAKRLEDEEIRFIELGRNKKDELDSVVMDSEMFQRFIALGNEVRGW
ncbi:MAG: ATP-binding protein, partial [Sulfurovum sp.]|nr:ATP-binding protein [Sulfurovum sp.]